MTTPYSHRQIKKWKHDNALFYIPAEFDESNVPDSKYFIQKLKF